MLQTSAHRFAAGTTYTGEVRRIAPATPPPVDRSPAQPVALHGGIRVPTRTNIVGQIALAVSIIGSICVTVALITVTAPPIATGVLLIIGWVLLPIGFVLGISGAILPGKAKTASVAAMLTAVGGGLASGYVTLVMLFAMGHSALPN